MLILVFYIIFIIVIFFATISDYDNANVECPVCRSETDYTINVIKKGHCWKCGQLLDWN